MLTNADCTILTKQNGTYSPKIIRGVFWSEETKFDEAKSGISSADSLVVRIPLSSLSSAELNLKIGDLIVRGCMNTAVKSKAELEELFGKAYTVTGFRLNNIGSPQIRHWRVNGR